MSETSAMTRVPFLDLGPSHDPIKQALLADLAALIDSNAFTNGPHVAAFEQAWADYCGVEHCVGLASGLDALRLALLACEIQRGEEVLVPALTFAATFEAVSQSGGVPVPVDILWDDYNLDVEAAAAAISPRTRFLMPVHLYGQMCDLVAFRRLAATRQLLLVEDAAQAHGATRDGIGAGTAGHSAAFSFYPAKNLGAMGDAGALVTDDAGLADEVRARREHGQRAKYRHDLEGYTARLDTVQALVLLHKLRLLDGWNEERREIARLYTELLQDVGDLSLPRVPAGSEPVWHLYVVRTRSPEALSTFLATRGIATGRHYPEPPHLSEAYESLGYREGQFPVAETLANEGLSLPIYPGLTSEQVHAVVAGVIDFFDG